MKHNTPFSAPSGGANSKKTVMPPPSEDYRNNWEDIFGKQPVKNIGSQSKSEK